jgi:hypothetical protein
MSFRYELKRLGAPVLIGLASLLLAARIGISQANLETILFKFLVFCPALMLVHITRIGLFPYMDLSEAMEREGYANEDRDRGIILAAIIYYVGMTYVLTSTI